MCEFIPNPSSSITAAGQARRLNLYQWIVDDMQRGDRHLTRALTQWRDEMTTRLQGRTSVTRVLLPWIFVNALQLADQTALLYEDGAVCIGGPKEDGQYMPGPLLVRPKET